MTISNNKKLRKNKTNQPTQMTRNQRNIRGYFVFIRLVEILCVNTEKYDRQEKPLSTGKEHGWFILGVKSGFSSQGMVHGL